MRNLVRYRRIRHRVAIGTRTGRNRTGKSLGRFIDPSVKCPLQKYSDFQNSQITPYVRRPVPREGRFAIVTDAGRDVVAAGSAEDESAFLRTAKSYGPDVSTLASSLREAISAGDGDKKARSPGRVRHKP